MVFGYARVSTDGQSVDVRVKALRSAGAKKVFRETASGATIDRRQLAAALKALGEGVRRHRRSERDLIHVRMSESRARAKARGVHLGRPIPLTPHQREEALRGLAKRKATRADIARRFNVSRSTISRLET